MAKKTVSRLLQLGGIQVSRTDRRRKLYKKLYEQFRDFTMVPEITFIKNLELCEQFTSIEGDFVECGVWKGGMSAATAMVLGKERSFHLFDSFEGLPSAREIDGPAAIEWQQNVSSPVYYDNCTADESFAVKAMELANHKNYTIHKGWFEQTLKSFEAFPISILRLDGDWYDSILICLEYLYPKVSEGGIVILDDYYTWDGCSRAVHDYLSKTGSVARIFQWNNEIAFLIKKS
jgi:O-methyltransferase